MPASPLQRARARLRGQERKVVRDGAGVIGCAGHLVPGDQDGKIPGIWERMAVIEVSGSWSSEQDKKKILPRKGQEGSGQWTPIPTGFVSAADPCTGSEDPSQVSQPGNQEMQLGAGSGGCCRPLSGGKQGLASEGQCSPGHP